MAEDLFGKLVICGNVENKAIHFKINKKLIDRLSQMEIQKLQGAIFRITEQLAADLAYLTVTPIRNNQIEWLSVDDLNYDI